PAGLRETGGKRHLHEDHVRIVDYTNIVDRIKQLLRRLGVRLRKESRLPLRRVVSIAAASAALLAAHPATAQISMTQSAGLAGNNAGTSATSTAFTTS